MCLLFLFYPTDVDYELYEAILLYHWKDSSANDHRAARSVQQGVNVV